MNSDTEEIKTRLNIVDVLGEYIRLDKAGSNWRALCPFHNEKSPSFMVSEERQFWHCFGCQKSGDIFSFVMEMEGLDFREALSQLAEKAGVQLKNYNSGKAEEKNRTLELLELATKWYDHQLWKGPGKIKILQYLRERGLQDETIKKFRLGYAPNGWRNILTFLSSRDYKTDEILRSGLIVRKTDTKTENCYDRFRDRVMFPIADYTGRTLGYSARVAPGGDESQAKYVNTPETEVYHKSQILYGIDKARNEIKKKDFVLLVEGNMDVVASHQAGIENVIAVSGTALTEDQINIIKRYTKNIKMFFDMDSAGESATKKSIKLCFSQEMNVKVIQLPEGKDAAEIAKEDPKLLREAVGKAKNIMDYFFENTLKKYKKDDVESRKKIVDELLDRISMLKYLPDKNYWIKKLAESINNSGASIHEDEKALTDMLKKASLKNKIEESKDASPNEPIRTRSKKELLVGELIGLMFVSIVAWKEAVKEAEKIVPWSQDSLLLLALQEGEKVNFDFDKFILEIQEERELVTQAERILFEKKYQLDLNNNLEEVISKDPLKDFYVCLKELNKEDKRKELLRIASDLKTAEKRKDQNAMVFLRQEFDKISRGLNKLTD